MSTENSGQIVRHTCRPATRFLHLRDQTGLALGLRLQGACDSPLVLAGSGSLRAGEAEPASLAQHRIVIVPPTFRQSLEVGRVQRRRGPLQRRDPA